MIRKSIIVVALTLSLIQLTAFGQTDFKPGYYISLDNDTVYGLIDYRGDIRNSRICVFKKDENSESVKFKADEIKRYRFIDSKFYISKLVKTVDGEKYIFVEFLVNGIADLFYYKDADGDHYLIETKDGGLVELKNENEQFYVEGRGEVIRETNKHIGILKVTFADCMEVQSQIDKVKLDHKSLINITKNYHDYVCDGEKCIIYEKKLPILKISWGPVVGYGMADFKLENVNIKFDKSRYIIGGVNLNITIPRLNEKLSLQLGTQLSQRYFYSLHQERNTYFDIHIHSLFVQSSAGIKYTYPKGKLRPTLAVGVSLLKCLNTNERVIQEVVGYSTVTTNEYNAFPFSSTLYGGFAQIGFDYLFSKKLRGFTNLQYFYNTGVSDNPYGIGVFDWSYISYKYNVFIQSVNFNIGLYF